MPTADVRDAIPAHLDDETLVALRAQLPVTDDATWSRVVSVLRDVKTWKRRSKRTRSAFVDRLFSAKTAAPDVDAVEVFAGVISTEDDDEVCIVRFGVAPTGTWWPTIDPGHPATSRLAKLAAAFDESGVHGDGRVDIREIPTLTYVPARDAQLEADLARVITMFDPSGPVFWGDLASMLQGYADDETPEGILEYAREEFFNPGSWGCGVSGTLYGFRVSVWNLAGCEPDEVLYAVDLATGEEHFLTVQGV